MEWIRLPFIRFSLFFGAVLGVLESLGPLSGASIEPVAIAVLTMIFVTRRSGPRWTIWGALLAIVISALHARVDTSRHSMVFAVGEGRTRAEVVGRVVTPARSIDDRWSTVLELERVDDREVSVRVDLRGDGVAPTAGSRILAFVQLERPAPDDFPSKRHRRRTAERQRRPLRALALETPMLLDSHSGPVRGLEWLSERRLRMQQRLLTELGELRGGLAVALITGEKAWVNPRVMQAYNDTGTAHVLAISGLHFGIIAMLAWFVSLALIRRSSWLMRRWGDRRVAGLAVALVLSIFLLFVGAPISAIRAWVVALLLILSLASLRAFCPFHALAWAFVTVLAVEPWAIRELGFQLSFAATLGILIFMDRKPGWLDANAFGEESRGRRFARAVGLTVGISTAATALTTPIILAHTGFVSIGSFWLNLLVVPVVSMLLFPMLLAGVVLDSAGLTCGLEMAGFTMDGMLAMAHLLEWAARLPGQSIVMGVPPLAATITLFLATALLLARPRLIPAVVLTAVLAVAIGWADRAHSPPNSVELHMIPVGQGDSLLVRLPGGDILIDAGGAMMGRDPGRAIVMPYLRRIGISKLDAVVVTHDDIDHVGGLSAIEELFEVARFIDGSSTPLALSDGAARVMLGRARGCDGDNEASVVTILEIDGRRSAILTGDIEECAEGWVSRRRIDAPVVQAPHHGSNSSSSPAFIQATGARLVLVSAGRHSRFGHPHGDVLRRWYAYGSRLLTTPRHGLVVLRWRGSLQIHSTRPIWAARAYSGVPSAPIGHETTGGTISLGSPSPRK